MEHYLIYIALVILLYCLFSARISETGITMPMIFLAFGVIIGTKGFQLDFDTATAFHHLAELTLAFLLFADATQLRRKALENIGERTGRMLLIGLPLAIVLGAGVNLVFLPDWPFWEAFVLAALLAPTDAALGQSIQTNTKIPQDFRDAMNAESGLNDGLALPFVIFFAGLAASEIDPELGDAVLIKLVLGQICIGALVGLVGGFVVGKVRDYVATHDMMNENLGQVAVLALVGVIFFAAERLGGNSFVAVFVSGIAFANASKRSVTHVREFLEEDGQFLAMLSFFFIGALFVPQALGHVTVPILIVISLSLLVVRPLAIWLSLVGTDTSANERLFYGWFGPRGLATALFAVFVVKDFDGVEQENGILVVAITAVLISAVVHGITAKFASPLFGLQTTKRDP